MWGGEKGKGGRDRMHLTSSSIYCQGVGKGMDLVQFGRRECGGGEWRERAVNCRKRGRRERLC